MVQCKPGSDILRVLVSAADCCFSRACTVRGARRCPTSCEDGFRVQSVTYSVLEIDNILLL